MSEDQKTAKEIIYEHRIRIREDWGMTREGAIAAIKISDAQYKRQQQQQQQQ